MTTPIDAPRDLDTHITAAAIAARHDASIHTVRTLFRDGVIPGSKIGIHGWVTTWRSYLDWLTTWATDAHRYPLTTRDIATKYGVHLVTARRYFVKHGAPGKRVRTPFDRIALWRANPEEFDAWLRVNRVPPYGHGTPAAED